MPYKIVDGAMKKEAAPKKPTLDNMRELTARIAELEAAVTEKDKTIAKYEAALKK